MCSMYWTLLRVTFTCPSCGEPGIDDLQTHFMGDVGSCMNYYEIGEVIPELEGWNGTLGAIDSFLGNCPACDVWIDFDARIQDGAVIEVWPKEKRP